MLFTYYTRSYAFSIDDERCIGIHDRSTDHPFYEMAGARFVGASLAPGYVPDIQPLVLGSRLVFQKGACTIITEPIETMKLGPYEDSPNPMREPLPTLPEFLVEISPDYLLEDPG